MDDARHESQTPKGTRLLGYARRSSPLWAANNYGPGPELDLEGLERLASEEVPGLEAALGEALLVVVAQEGVEHVTVGVEAIGPPVFAHLAARFLDMRGEPGHHRGERGGLAIHFHGALFRGHQGLV